MDLFTITCTTCKSRLKVRDQSAVGQILACPKCGGMVMVKPPPAWQDAGQQKSDLPTATELTTPPGAPINQTFDSSAFDVVDELLSDAPPKVSPSPSFTPPPSATPSPSKPRFVGGPPRRQTPPPFTSTSLSPQSPKASGGRKPTEAIDPAKSQGTASPAPPPPAETDAHAAPHPPGQTTSARFWLFIAGSIVLGVSLAIGMVILVLFFRPPVRAIAQQPQHNPPSQPTTIGDDTASAPSTQPADPNEQPITPPPTVQQSEPETPPAPKTAAQNAESDPVGLIAGPPAQPPADTANSTAPLARFDRVIDDSASDPLASVPSALPEGAATAPPDAAPPRPLAPRPPPREIDVTRRLADPIASLETAGTPLADFVQLMSDLSTIPITLDLPLAPATAESPVVLRLTNATVGSALKDALAPLRLEYVVIDDQLVVRRPEPSPFVAITHPVKDLTGGDPEPAAELVELLKAVIEPSTWEAGEASGSLTLDATKASLIITHRRAIQFQVLTAVEKLRAARQPPLPHVLKLDRSLFKPDSRWSQAQAALQRPISLNYNQPTRLLTILDRLSETAGGRIVVDWLDVAAASWNPAAEAKLLVANQPLSAALDALLDPLDLTWRVIDGRTIQVVTPARLNDQCEFELYPLNDLLAGAEGDALVQRARASLGEALFRDSGGNGELRYDAATKCLLAWLPQAKQRELETLLTSWRSGSK